MAKTREKLDRWLAGRNVLRSSQLRRFEDYEERRVLAKRKHHLHHLAKTRRLNSTQYRELYGEDYFENLTRQQAEKLHKDVFSLIREHSRKIYAGSGRPQACLVCGYSFAVDIHHIKAVSKFKSQATILEINAIDNLVALCKNHHNEVERKHRTLTNEWIKDHYDHFEISVVGW